MDEKAQLYYIINKKFEEIQKWHRQKHSEELEISGWLKKLKQ